VPRRCPLGHVPRDTRRGVRRNGSGARRAGAKTVSREKQKRERCSARGRGRGDGLRDRFASTPPCAKSGTSPPQAGSQRFKGSLDLAPRLVGGAARAFTHPARQDDENRLSTPVTGVASERDDEARRWR
jgi:hypothetical protein